MRSPMACGEATRNSPGSPIGHGGIHKPRLDGDDAHTAGIQAVAQPLQVQAQRAFRGAIHIVALPAAVSRHRRNADDETALQRLEIIGAMAEDGSRPGEVAGDDFFAQLEIARRLRIAEIAESQHHAGKIRHFFYHGLQEGLVGFGRFRIEQTIAHFDAVAQPQIRGDAL